MALEHTLDEDGDHDEEACYLCLLGKEVKSECRCGKCCSHMIIEALPEDAELEPKIRELGRRLFPWRSTRRAAGRNSKGICSTRRTGRASSSTGPRISARSTKPGRSCAA